MSINLSKKKRDNMLSFLKELKKKMEDKEDLRKLIEIERTLQEKKYGLIWEEHKEKIDEILERNIPILREIENKKFTNPVKIGGGVDSFNYLIEGDNLHSLKILEKTHRGKIDVIYIDPPYNKGNRDFIYDDNYVDKNDGYRHSKWLSFMNKRLNIAKKLLKDEGIIFISIDDKEQAQLKLLCDEVFGESNFIATYKWNKTATAPSLSLKVRNKYEYVLCYEKNRTNIPYYAGLTDGGDVPLLNRGNNYRLIEFPKDKLKFNFNGFFAKGIYDRVELINDIEIKNGYAKENIFINAEFKWTQEYLNNEIKNGTTFIIKTKKMSVRFIRKKETDKKPADIISKLECDVDTNEEGKKELKALVPDNKMDYPKPLSLIKYLISFSKNKNLIVLDFFAGSGTTGHAVAQLNKEDGGNRKYILCTNNENNICEEVTYKRLKNIQKELPHNLKYLKTDYIPKRSKDEDDLSIRKKVEKNIKELIELENHIEIDNQKYIIAESEEKMEEDINRIEKNGILFLPPGIFLSRIEQRKLDEKNIKLVNIPEYYFINELREAGEI